MLHEKQPTLIWSIIDMAMIGDSGEFGKSTSNVGKVDLLLQIEQLLEKIEVQSLDSQDFAVKSLTGLFLDESFGDNTTVMRLHLQQLVKIQQILRDLMDLKLQS